MPHAPGTERAQLPTDAGQHRQSSDHSPHGRGSGEVGGYTDLQWVLPVELLLLEGLDGEAVMIESIVRVESAPGGGFSVSGCEVGVLGEFVEGGLVGAGCGT